MADAQNGTLGAVSEHISGAPPENQGANPCTTLDLAPLFHRLRPSKPMELFNQFCHWYGAGMIGVTVIVAAGLIYSRFGGK